MSPATENQLEKLTRLPTNFFPSPQEVTVTHVSDQSEKPRVIVLAYDQSNFGDAMIAKSISQGLLKPNDHIHLLNIVNQKDYHSLFAPLISANSTVIGIHEESKPSAVASAAEFMLLEITNCLRKNGFSNVTTEVMRGDPKESIIDYCRMIKPVYLITGTRGFGAIKKTVFGSVSSYLIKHCPCPVIVCKLTSEEIDARKELDAKKQATFANVLNKFQKSSEH